LEKGNSKQDVAGSMTGSIDNVKQFRGNKIFQHMDRLGEWQRGSKPIPIVAEIDPTNVCNLKCPYCSFSAVHGNGHLEQDVLLRVIEELAALGVRGVTFTGGGEPLCSTATMAAVSRAKEAGMDVGFITNGVLLTRDHGRVILDNCKMTGFIKTPPGKLSSIPAVQ